MSNDTSTAKRSNGVTFAVPQSAKSRMHAANENKKSHKSKGKPSYFWTSIDVNRWLKRHCGQYYHLYGNLFLDQDITGRTLVRLTDFKLQKMAITDANHRDELMRHILRLRLKTEARELKQCDQRTGI